MPQETRDRIVEAAYRTLVALGYEQTSIKEIAAAAAVAPGLVHYYFASKEELVVAAIRFGCDEFEKMEGADPERDALEAFEGARRMLRERRFDFHRLFLDMCGVAMHNDAVAEALRRFVEEDRGIAEALARNLLALRERDAAEAPPIAAAVWGAIFGIVLQALLDPEFDHEGAMTALTRMAMEGA